MSFIEAITPDANGYVQALFVSDDVAAQIIMASRKGKPDAISSGMIEAHVGNHEGLGDWSLTRESTAAGWILVASNEPQPDNLRELIGPDANFIGD